MPDVPPAFAPSKLALILAVEEALRARSLERLAALVLDASTVETACRGAPPAERRDELARVDRLRASITVQLEECLALTNWPAATRLALNYGTDVTKRACGARYQELEDSELFFAVGDEVVKVKLFDMFQSGGRVGLVKVRCSKKKGSAADFSRFRSNCPAGHWKRVTQSDGVCPKP